MIELGIYAAVGAVVDAMSYTSILGTQGVE
jgi:hypothetical protein